MARRPKLPDVKKKAQSRGEVGDIRYKHLLRLHSIVYHVHQVLRFHADDEDSMRTSICQYVVALATYLETFFRDIFRYAIENDPPAFERIVQQHRIRVPFEQELRSVGIDGCDFITEALTLQSAGSIADAFDPFFAPDGFRAAVEKSRIPYAIPSRLAFYRGFPVTALPNWWTDLEMLFELRHQIVHDVNCQPMVDRSRAAELESVAVVLPQYVAMMFGANGLASRSADGGALPVMFLVEDLLATDWEVVVDAEID